VTFIPHTKSLFDVLPGAGASAAVGHIPQATSWYSSLRQIASSMSDCHNLLQPPNCLGLHYFLVPFSHCGPLLLSLCIIPILHGPPILEALRVATSLPLLIIGHGPSESIYFVCCKKRICWLVTFICACHGK
jgi:hypothetical protein